MNVHMTRTLVGIAIAGAMAGAAYGGTALAHAAPQTVNLSDLPDIDTYPICRMEDGSDVPVDRLPCVWNNDGNAWLTYQDQSFLIIDDTTVAGSAVGDHVVWIDPATGEAWRSREDCPNTACTATSNWNVVASGPNSWDEGAYVGGYN